MDKEYLIENLYDFTVKDFFYMLDKHFYDGDVKKRCMEEQWTKDDGLESHSSFLARE